MRLEAKVSLAVALEDEFLDQQNPLTRGGGRDSDCQREGQRGAVWHWRAQPSTIKPLHHHPKCSPRRSSFVSSHLASAHPHPHYPHARWSPGGLKGIPKPGRTGGGSPGLILPLLVLLQAPPPLAEGGLLRLLPGLPQSPPATSAQIWRNSLTPSPSRDPGDRRLRAAAAAGLRAGASVRGAWRARRARPWLYACRVSVAWPVRVSVCVCERACARRHRRPRLPAAAPLPRRGRAPGRGRASVRQGPRRRLSVRPRPPRPAPSAGLPAASPSAPRPRGPADTRTLTDTHPPGGGLAGSAAAAAAPWEAAAPRPRGPAEPGHPLSGPPALLTRRGPGPVATAHSTAGGKLAAGRAAPGAQRPPATARFAPAQGRPHPGTRLHPWTPLRPTPAPPRPDL
ncbi:uncharacterized protein LOC110597848 [Ictidomys tridecemlineatus]